MSSPRLLHALALYLLCLAGCSSLPTIAPDLAPGPRAAVQLAGAHGPLSAAQSKAVLDRLSSSGVPTDIFERHLALEEAVVGSPLTTGNEVLLLQDGPATYRAMFAAIAAAQDHINMETYILEDDEVGQRFAQALIAKQRQGVQVNLIRDGIGSFGTPAAFFQQLADSGIQVLEFNPVNPLLARGPWELNQRDHRKLLIVDGRTAFLGGINISSVYSGGSFRRRSHASDPSAPAKLGSDPNYPVRPEPAANLGAEPEDQNRSAAPGKSVSDPNTSVDMAAGQELDVPQASLAWRDTDLQLQGPVVAEFQKLFLETWEKQRGPPLAQRNYFPPPQKAGQEVVRAIGSSPDDPFSLIYATLLSAIGSAETSVHLTNAYFAPDPQLLAALEAAAHRGVDVKLILPSSTDSWLVFYAGRAFYEQLLAAGVHIYERRGVILHSKTALIDGVWATIGSTNLDWRSFLHNQEVNAVVLGTGFGAQVQAMFDKDIAASDAISLQQWQRRPIAQRFKEMFSRAWAYWL
jgi:cardiolipin synthase